jgi:hypothetical protein
LTRNPPLRWSLEQLDTNFCFIDLFFPGGSIGGIFKVRVIASDVDYWASLLADMWEYSDDSPQVLGCNGSRGKPFVKRVDEANAVNDLRKGFLKVSVFFKLLRA